MEQGLAEASTQKYGSGEGNTTTHAYGGLMDKLKKKKNEVTANDKDKRPVFKSVSGIRG